MAKKLIPFQKKHKCIQTIQVDTHQNSTLHALSTLKMGNVYTVYMLRKCRAQAFCLKKLQQKVVT